MSSFNNTDIHRIFTSLDQNCDGLVSVEELSWLLEKTGVHTSDEELVSLVGETGLDLDEFSRFYENILVNEQKGKNDISDSSEEEEEEDEDLYRAFRVFDLDGDGLVSSKELQSVLGRLGMWEDNNGGLDFDRIMHKFDVNCDGFVDFEEFKIMMLAH